jgi:hypothetical protein
MSKLVLGLVWALGAALWLAAAVFQAKSGNNGVAWLDSGVCTLYVLCSFNYLSQVG